MNEIHPSTELLKFLEGQTQPGWLDAFNAVLHFSNDKSFGFNYSLMLIRALEVFLRFPKFSSVSIHLLNTETFEFEHTISLPPSSDFTANQRFETLLETETITHALESGNLAYHMVETTTGFRQNFFVMPLIGTTGVLGILVLELDAEITSIEQIVPALITLHSNHLASLIQQQSLKKDIEIASDLLEQKVSLKTEDVKQSKRELQLILDSIQAGVLIIDKNNNQITGANQVALELLGVRNDELLGTDRSAYSSGLDPFKSSIGYAILEGDVSEDRILRFDGTEIPILKKVTGIELGGANYFLESFIDITDRIKFEEALKNSESKFRAIFEKVGLGMFLVSTDGVIIDSNYALLSMLGYSRNEIRKLTLNKLIHREDYSDSLLHEEFTANKLLYQNVGVEKRFIKKDSQVIWGKVTFSTISDMQGNANFIVVMVEDITAQKKNQILINKQNHLLAGVTEAINILLSEPDFEKAIGICLGGIGRAARADRISLYENHYQKEELRISAKRKYTWNKEYENAVNSDFEPIEINYNLFPGLLEKLTIGDEFVGTVKDYPTSFLPYLERYSAQVLTIIPIHMEGKLWGGLTLIDAEQNREWSEQELSLLKTVSRSIGAAFKRNQERGELLESKLKAVEASHLKTSLLANMSHELRTPMNGILGFAQILTEELSDKDQIELADKILTSSFRLMGTLNSILNLSKLEANKLEAKLELLPTHEHVKKVFSQFMKVAQSRGLSYEIEFVENEIFAYFDPNLFEQVLSNLIDNAIKYTEKGFVRVTLEMVNEKDEYYGSIKVSDSGIGIPADKHDYIFQEFRQASEGFGRSYEGSGLGLTLAKKMALLMGGDITLASELGKGSTFVFTVRAGMVKGNSHIEVSQPLALLTRTESSQKSEQELPLILTVEENSVNREVIEIFLRKIAKVEHAGDITSALQMASTKKYAMIIFDLNLSDDQEGLELVRQIRSLNSCKLTPLIALTGYALFGDRERLIQHGVTEVLPKPYKKEDLITIITKNLEKD